VNKLGAVVVAGLLLSGCDGNSLKLAACEASSDPRCPIRETCPGQCVPLPPFQWSFPLLLWAGSAALAPDCPTGLAEYEGHADPNEISECPSCSCEPPIGECELPSGLVASPQPCEVDESLRIVRDFSGLDPDPMSCNTDNGFAAGLMQSVTIVPPTMIERGCEPVTTLPSPKAGTASWKTFARACSDGYSPCLDAGAVCVSTAEPPPGFARCIYQPGEHDCPARYSNRRVFYDDVSDAGPCATCSCGAPEGSGCRTFVTVYVDAACSDGLLGRDMYLHAPPSCCNNPLSEALVGKTATALTYEPGSCEPSGGEPLGSVELLGPTTFCCQP
jgi:hypothetical protein